MKHTVPIKKNNEFLRVYKKGKFYVGKYLVLYVLKNNLDINRLGITVTRKIGKSVRRNRVKRLVRECYRYYEEKLGKGYDLVFMARESERLPEYKDILKEMKYLLKRLDIFSKNEKNEGEEEGNGEGASEGKTEEKTIEGKTVEEKNIEEKNY